MLSRAGEGQAATARRSSRSTRCRRRDWSASRTRRTPRGSPVGTALADLLLPVRLNGDLALFQAIGALLLEWDAVDHDFLGEYTTGFDEYAAHVADLDWAKVEASTGLTRAQITEAARMFADSAGDDHLLGDGHHPAPQRGGDHQGDRQRRPAARQHRQARRRRVPRARPLQRAGRPDDGHLGAGPRPLPRRHPRRVRLRAAARARPTTRSTPSRPCATARPGSSSGWAATSSAPPPTPRRPRRPCATRP